MRLQQKAEPAPEPAPEPANHEDPDAAEPAPANPAADGAEPTSAPEPEPIREGKPAPTCRDCGTTLKRGKAGRPPTRCADCKLEARRADYDQERKPLTLADRAYRNLRKRAAYARERAAWWTAEAERLSAEEASVQANRAGLADQPF